MLWVIRHPVENQEWVLAEQQTRIDPLESTTHTNFVCRIMDCKKCMFRLESSLDIVDS